ncbi:hypothetical protein [Achromobacter phage Motura]|uniref:Uncharacterized protein n=1 Tax=Achromobacter phage Motura TaxID=2591403 RepID=A0A514CT52_9CAUD|nr:hypothetical protein H1O15_gp158 [Achromobacter phage Motura]QDH83630.1 hypothetical protein [Achromobacter phage Motura]
MIIQAALRLRAASTDASNEAVLDAVDWLNSYVAQSSSVHSKYLTPQFVVKHLRPLVDAVPFVPVRGPYYWISERTKLDVRRVASFTTLNKPEEWEFLGDSIGQLNGTVYQVDNFKQVFTFEWAKKIMQYLKSAKIEDSRARNFQEVLDYGDQKEVIAICSSATTMKPVMQLDL